MINLARNIQVGDIVAYKRYGNELSAPWLVVGESHHYGDHGKLHLTQQWNPDKKDVFGEPYEQRLEGWLVLGRAP